MSDLINLVKIYLFSDFVEFFLLRYSFKICGSTKTKQIKAISSNKKLKTHEIQKNNRRSSNFRFMIGCWKKNVKMRVKMNFRLERQFFVGCDPF